MPHATAAINRKPAAIDPKVTGSVGSTPTSIDWMTRVRTSAAAAPHARPAALSFRALPNHHPEHAAVLRPERHPDTDFGLPLADTRRQDAIQPDRRQNQRDCGEDRNQHERELRLRLRAADEGQHRLHVDCPNSWVH
jgi:hypothetical protein